MTVRVIRLVLVIWRWLKGQWIMSCLFEGCKKRTNYINETLCKINKMFLPCSVACSRYSSIIVQCVQSKLYCCNKWKQQLQIMKAILKGSQKPSKLLFSKHCVPVLVPSLVLCENFCAVWRAMHYQEGQLYSFVKSRGTAWRWLSVSRQGASLLTQNMSGLVEILKSLLTIMTSGMTAVSPSTRHVYRFVRQLITSSLLWEQKRNVNVVIGNT